MIKVFKVKDLIGYLVKIIIVLVAVALVIKVLEIGKKDGENETATDLSSTWLFCIDDMLPQIGINKEVEETKETSGVKFAFASELEVMESIENNEMVEENTVNTEEQNNNNVSEKNPQNETSNGEINRELTVTEVDNSGVNPRYTDEYNGVFINNGTNYQLTQEMLTPDVEVNKNKVVIYHTHTCESYTPTEQYQYTASGNFRTIDLNFSVSRVGDELEKWLSTYGCTVIHDRTYHDYPAYNGSYSRSLVTAQNVLSTNQDADIVIDLHRDAIADETYGPRVKIGDEYVSQLMFVIGTDGANSAHTNWLQNLKFAIKVQQKANELYPGLFKPIILRNSEYNQHVAKAACIIEVGSTGNTLEESMGAMKYLARILEET